MPASSPEGKPQAVEMLRGLEPRLILDIGPGEGTWATLLRPVFPTAQWHGVEIWEPYLERYGLDRLYDRVVVGDAAQISLHLVAHCYDLAIFGDVIEHTGKVRAMKMVERFPWKHALVSVPIVDYPQGPWEGNPYEEHIATWTAEEVLASFPVVDHWTGSELGVFLLAR